MEKHHSMLDRVDVWRFTVLELFFGLEISSLFLATLNLNPLFHLILGVLMMLVKLLELRDEGWKKKFRVWVKIWVRLNFEKSEKNERKIWDGFQISVAASFF
jgi:hypothetical protein